MPIRRLFDFSGGSHGYCSLGVCVDDVVYAAGLNGGRSGDLTSQFTAALAQMRECVERAGGSIDNVARAVAFVAAAGDRMPLYEPWDRLFPDASDRPAFKVLVAALPPGLRVQLDFVAILDERRHRLDIEGVPARDPTVRSGRWIFTSRVHGTAPHAGVAVSLDSETEQAIGNVQTLMACQTATLKCPVGPGRHYVRHDLRGTDP